MLQFSAMIQQLLLGTISYERMFLTQLFLGQLLDSGSICITCMQLSQRFIFFGQVFPQTLFAFANPITKTNSAIIEIRGCKTRFSVIDIISILTYFRFPILFLPYNCFLTITTMIMFFNTRVHYCGLIIVYNLIVVI